MSPLMTALYITDGALSLIVLLLIALLIYQLFKICVRKAEAPYGGLMTTMEQLSPMQPTQKSVYSLQCTQKEVPSKTVVVIDLQDLIIKKSLNTARLQEESVSEESEIETKSIGELGIQEPIEFEPKSLVFASGESTIQKIGMNNVTRRRLAIKVLCSNNNVYRVEPVYSFIDPKQKFEAEVHRLEDGKPPKDERLKFVITEAQPTDINIRELFKQPNIKTVEMEYKILVDANRQVKFVGNASSLPVPAKT